MTDNGDVDNDFRMAGLRGRVEGQLSNGALVGGTLHAAWSHYETTDPYSGLMPGRRRSVLGTLYWEDQLTPVWGSRLTGGYYLEDYDVSGGSPHSTLGRKISADWRNGFELGEKVELVLGGLAEWTDYKSTVVGSPHEKNWLTAVYGNILWSPVESLHLGLGGRAESYEVWDEQETWRATASWETPLEGLRFRGSYGTGFRAPSFYELYGRYSFGPDFNFEGNPDLNPEKSRGWDIGVEWERDWGRLELTYFESRVRNFIDYVGGNPASYDNGGHSRVRGVEFGAGGKFLSDKMEWKVASTWMRAEDRDSGEDLLRRPRWNAGFDLRAHPVEKLLVGLGGSYVGKRDDRDFSQYPAARVELDDYFLLRLYASYDWTEHLRTNLRFENVLDDHYEVVKGMDSTDFGVFAGIDWTF